MALWEKFKYQKQAAKKFKPNSGGDNEEDQSEPPERNSFDCLLNTPDRLSSGLDSNISCIPETPTSLENTPSKSPIFSKQGRHQPAMDGQKKVAAADTTTSKSNGIDMKRGVKRRFRLVSESAESDATDSPSKTDQPSSPVFGVPLPSAHSHLNGHVSHTCSQDTSKKDTVECIDIPSDSDSDDQTTCDDKPSTMSMTPTTPSPGKRRTARMGLSESPIVAAQKKAYRRIRLTSDSRDDSEETQLEEDKEELVQDLQKRFPKRAREDLINVLVGLEWSLFDAIQTLREADDRLSESEEDDTSAASGSWNQSSKSSRGESSGWLSKAKPPESSQVNGSSYSYTTNESSSEYTGHTCGTAKNRRRKERAVAVPQEYQNKNNIKKSTKTTKPKPARRRIRQMASSSDEDESEKTQNEDKGADTVPSSDEESEKLKDENGDDDDDDYDGDSVTNARTSKAVVDDDDDDDGKGGIYDDEMPTFNKLVLSFFNDATIEELVGIDECSKSKAQKIVALRPFEHFEDLLEKLEDAKGLGEHLVWNSRNIFQEREVVVFLMNKCSFIAERIQSIISSQMGGDKNREDGGDDFSKLRIKQEPSTMNPEHKLKPYQIIGLNWLALLHKEGVSGILADEMGLGKTVQTIAFLAYLLEQGNQGPHVIIVPSSTIENWYRELMKWCPSLELLMYSGDQGYRAELRGSIMDGSTPYNVIVTTYNTCTSTIEDRALFRKVRFQYAIFDEGHMLKNMNSNRYQHLMKINTKRRLLLTGTPMQNNLLELISLLSFVMPDIFMNKASELKKIFCFQKLKAYGIETEKSDFEEERIAHAKQIMQPFMLRRIKSQVLKQLPAKKESVQHVEMTADQKKRYDDLKASIIKDIKNTEDKSRKGCKMSSALMELRKMANHPLLIRHHYNNDKLKEMAHLMLKEPTHYDADPVLIQEDMAVMTDFELHRLCREYGVLTPYRLDTELIVSSGKFQVLDNLLPKMKEEGSRVLLFSQFVMVLDIVEPYMKHHGYKYLRLDGQTQVADRLDMIDKFNAEPDIFIFLLSTRAGGLGINLTAANVVILHDIDYNPYNDKQAEDRCHRVGQTKDVSVIRLISKGTIEENMLKCAQYKLRLEVKMTTNKEDAEDDKGGDVAAMLKQALDI